MTTAAIAAALDVMPKEGHGYVRETVHLLEDGETEVPAVVIDATFTVPQLRQMARAIICHTEKGHHIAVGDHQATSSRPMLAAVFASVLSGFVMGIAITALVFSN
jgi:hypothetical protein